MKDRFNITYYDRASGTLKRERVYAAEFLYRCYNTGTGRLFTRLFLRRKSVSSLYGWWHRQPWSRRKISAFASKMGVNLDELIQPLESFRSFAEFFSREIDLTRRPVNPDRDVCIAPADGKVLAYLSVEPGQTFQIKSSIFNLSSFLKNDQLAAVYSGGAMIISRLCLTDYHHFHFPDSGVPGTAMTIKGCYQAGGPYSLHRTVKFYMENQRMLTLLDSQHFGLMAMVEIGALTVGSIQQQYQAGVQAKKGQHKGCFELGGSTAVLLFTKGAIAIDHDLLENTAQGIETYVRLGDSIGRASKISKRRGDLP